jgi:hypothetical protein
MDNGAGQECSATFSGGHRAQGPGCQVLDPHEFKGCVGSIASWSGSSSLEKKPVRTASIAVSLPERPAWKC